MSITNVKLNGTQVNVEDTSAHEKIGDLSRLDTSAKTDLVSAINEAAQTGSSGGGDSYMYVEGNTLFMGDSMNESIAITQNGSYNVKKYATANVNVKPTGTLEIRENGRYDISDYAYIIVSVSGGGDVEPEHLSLFSDLSATGDKITRQSANSLSVSGSNTGWTQYAQTNGNTYTLSDLNEKYIVFKFKVSDTAVISALNASFAVTPSASATASSSRTAYGTTNIVRQAVDDGNGLYTYRINFNDIDSSVFEQLTAHPNYYLKIYFFFYTSISVTGTISDIEFYMEGDNASN